MDVDHSEPSRESPEGPLAVLIVEDEALIAMHIQMFVEAAGHRVCAVASTADEAVSAARTHQPDVAVMDMRLADGSSGEDAARVLHDSLSVRSIFLSGNLDPITADRLQALSPIALLNKPFFPSELEQALADADADRLQRCGAF